MRKLILLLVVLGLLSPAGFAAMQEKDDQQQTTDDEDKTQQSDDKEEELTLKQLFPEKSLFGPSARSMAFSEDGKYAAYLYRPYSERRHGSDLWIYDVESGETKRVTSVSVMDEFQKTTRQVRKDRIKKAKKRASKKKDSGEKDDDATNDDGVSGEWEGTLKGDDESDLPPDGIAFTLTIEVADDGTLSGTIVTPLNSGTRIVSRRPRSEQARRKIPVRRTTTPPTTTACRVNGKAHSRAMTNPIFRRTESLLRSPLKSQMMAH